MAKVDVKKAGWVGGIVTIIPVLILVSNEVQDWMQMKQQMRLAEMERQLEVSGPMIPGPTLEARVDSLEAKHEGDGL